MTQTKKKLSESLPFILWGAAGVLVLAMLFARAVFPELLWLTIIVGVLLVAVFALLIRENRKALRSRTAAYGLNSAIMIILIVAIVGVLNFLSARYPLKADLTKNKVHTLSDQTEKIVKGLKNSLKATLYVKMGQREQLRPMLENYKAFSPKFELEFVDPDKARTRAEQAGVKKYGTLVLNYGQKETKIDDVNEEKLTNAIIKIVKEKPVTFCVLTGHGEKNFSSNEPDGYEAARKALAGQSYEIKDLNLIQEQKVPESCDALAIVGPTKAFFEPEVKAVQDYLKNGGRAIFAVDVNLKGAEYSPELLGILESWYIKALPGLIIDPLSRMFNTDAAVPMLATFSKENAITKGFQGTDKCFFPFARPLEVVPGSPGELKVQWLAQTTPMSRGIMDLKRIAGGEVKLDPAKDRAGPMNAAIAVEGKHKESKGSRNTRLVAFGSSQFATNNFSRFGNNIDLFLNAVSWVLEDESLISIRAKEDGPGKIEMSQKSGTFIFLLTVVVVPLLVAAGGIVVWVLRRRL